MCCATKTAYSPLYPRGGEISTDEAFAMLRKAAMILWLCFSIAQRHIIGLAIKEVLVQEDGVGAGIPVYGCSIYCCRWQKRLNKTRSCLPATKSDEPPKNQAAKSWF